MTHKVKIENTSREELEKRIQEALKTAFYYSQNDGEHHKTWAIDQMVRALTGDEYPSWVASYEHDEKTQEEYEWEIGIAP